MDCDCVCILESSRGDSSIESQPHTEEPKNVDCHVYETAKKLHVEKKSADHLKSDTALESSCLQDNTEIFIGTRSPTARMDLMQSPISCATDSEEQCAHPSSNSAADSSWSRDEDANPSATADQPEIPTFINVYFADFPSRQTSDPSGLTVEDYKRYESDHIKKAKETIKLIFTNRTAARLREIVGEQDCKYLADCVMEGKRVEFYADREYSMQEICEYYRYMNEIESYQCLAIIAPHPWKENEPRDFKDITKTFCIKAFPKDHFNEERLAMVVTYREVDNFKQVGQ